MNSPTITPAIKAGDIITFKPAWRDAGDEKYVFTAVDDAEDGRVTVCADLGLPINPTSVVSTYMIEGQPDREAR